MIQPGLVTLPGVTLPGVTKLPCVGKRPCVVTLPGTEAASAELIEGFSKWEDAGSKFLTDRNGPRE